MVNEKFASADDVQPPEAVDADKDAAATKIQAGFTGMMVRQELEADSLEKQGCNSIDCPESCLEL